MESIIIRVPRWRQIVPFLGCTVILAISVFALKTRGSHWLTWTVSSAAAIGALGLIGMLDADNKRLVIDKTGVWSFDWQTDVVRWEEMRSVSLRSEGDVDYICFTVHDHEALRHRTGAGGRIILDARRAKGYGDLALNCTHLGLSAKEVVELASEMIARKAPRP